MSRIHSEWVTDFHGERLLRVYKKKGFISQEQLQHYLLYELREYGFYVSIINAGESACGGSGWPEDGPDCDDVIELYRYDHEERCPVCGSMSVPNYCVSCGLPIDLTKDYDEPIKVFRGDGQDRRPFYQLACSYSQNGESRVCNCGVSDSLTSLQKLMCGHVQELISLDRQDGFFRLPFPSAVDLPKSIQYEWDYAGLRVEYAVSRANVLLQETGPVVGR